MRQFFNALLSSISLNINYDILLFIGGQSNAVGTTGVPIVEYQGDITGGFIDNGAVFTQLNYPANNKGSEHGIELSFTRKFNDQYNKNVYISKEAVGGTAIADDGARDDWNPSTNELINDIIAGVNRLATQKLATPDSKFVFYFNQGERDVTLGTGAAWETIMNDIIAIVDAILPIDLIIITIVNEDASVNSGTVPKMTALRAAQNSFVSNEPRAVAIDMNDYTLGGDNVHFPSAEQIQLGIDVFDVVNASFN